ncbi:Germin-like protein 8-2 [Dionaea muscipula]
MYAPKMVAVIYAAVAAFMATSFLLAYATDPTLLQDFCVGVNDPNAAAFVNGLFCKNPENTTADDFFFSGLNIARSTNNKVGSNVTLLTATNFPGLNTLGISIARIDFAPLGLNPLHSHPRASEILTVLEGTLYAGFVTSNEANGGHQLFTKVLNEGDVFVVPQGLIHFQFNLANKASAVALVALSSQNPGVLTVANAVFGSTPPISIDVLTKSFQADSNVIKNIQSQFS